MLLFRFNDETGEITLTTDRCPCRGQNKDYCKYLLTALFHEGWSMEDWELNEVEDKEEFESEEEKGEKRESLQALLNHGEDELAVLSTRGR